MADPNPGLSPGTRRQIEIYTMGLAGQPVSVDELADRARAVLAPEAYDYLAGGAGTEETMRSNREAFRRRIRVARKRGPLQGTGELPRRE